MKSKLYLITIVFFIFVLTIACGTSDDISALSEDQKTEVASSQEESTIEPETEQEVDESEPIQEEPTNTKVPATPTIVFTPTKENTPTPESSPTSIPVGFFTNPIPVFETMELVLNDSDIFSLQILEVVRGDEAWTKIKNANMFNDEPIENMEYISILLKLVYISSEEDNILELNSYDFNVLSNYQYLDIPSVVDPEPSFDISLFPGGEGTGWLSFMVYETDPNPFLVIGKDYGSKASGFYFEITPNWASTDDFSYVETSNIFSDDDMASRTNPVPIGTTLQLIREDNQFFDVTVTEFIRGAEAWDIIIDANMFNDEPIEGQEYILAYVVVDYHEGPEGEILEVNSYDFDCVSGSQIMDSPFVVEPAPDLDFELLPGGKAGGWIAVLVKSDDPSPTLVLGLDNDGEGFYFKLYE